MSDERPLREESTRVPAEEEPSTPKRSQPLPADSVATPEKHSQAASSSADAPQVVKPLAPPTKEGWEKFPPSLFLGNWSDSLGHSIKVVTSVRDNQECLAATLSKSGKEDRELEVWPKGTGSWWTWTCGWGSLDWHYSSKTKLWWITWDGHGSRWERAKEADSQNAEKSVESSSTQERTAPEEAACHAPSASSSAPAGPSAESSAATAKVQASPVQILRVPQRKRIERMLHAWRAKDASQLSTSAKDFVNVWIGTETEQGWVHAERHDREKETGWLPINFLEELPNDRRWMKAVHLWQALDDSQCSVVKGSMVIVWTDSKTAEGWAFVASESESGGPEDIQVGWLPVVCLEWTE